MKITNQVWMAAKDCKYTFNGKNLHEFRRARLRKFAQAIGTSADGGHNEILRGLVARLDQMEAPDELSELSKLNAEASKQKDIDESGK